MAVFVERLKARLQARRPPAEFRPIDRWICVLESDAAAVRALSWGGLDLKLLKLQLQDYKAPHPVSFLTGPEPVAVACWMANAVPGGRWPCPNCDVDDFAVSMYHLTRCCCDVVGLLGADYNAAAHLFHAEAETALDAMIMDLVPENEYLATLIANDRLLDAASPPAVAARLRAGAANLGLRPPGDAESLPIFIDQVRQNRIRALGRAVLEMIRRRGRLNPARNPEAPPADADSAHDDAADEPEDSEHRPGRDSARTHARMPAGHAASPPGLPPAR